MAFYCLSLSYRLVFLLLLSLTITPTTSSWDWDWAWYVGPTFDPSPAPRFETMTETPDHEAVEFSSGGGDGAVLTNGFNMELRVIFCEECAYDIALGGLETPSEYGDLTSMKFGYLGIRARFATSTPSNNKDLGSIFHYVTGHPTSENFFGLEFWNDDTEHFYVVWGTDGTIHVMSPVEYPYDFGPGGTDPISNQRNVEYGLIYWRKEGTGEGCLLATMYDVVANVSLMNSSSSDAICSLEIPLPEESGNGLRMYTKPADPSTFNDGWNHSTPFSEWFRVWQVRWVEGLSKDEFPYIQPTSFHLTEFGDGHGDGAESSTSLLSEYITGRRIFCSYNAEMVDTNDRSIDFSIDNAGCPEECGPDDRPFKCGGLMGDYVPGTWGYFGIVLEFPDITESNAAEWAPVRFFAGPVTTSYSEIQLIFDPSHSSWKIDASDAEQTREYPGSYQPVALEIDLQDSYGEPIKSWEHEKMRNLEFGFAVYPYVGGDARTSIRCLKLFVYDIELENLLEIDVSCSTSIPPLEMRYYKARVHLQTGGDEIPFNRAKIATLRSYRWVGGYSTDTPFEFPRPDDCTYVKCVAPWTIVVPAVLSTIFVVVLVLGAFVIVVVVCVCCKKKHATSDGVPKKSDDDDDVIVVQSLPPEKKPAYATVDEMFQSESEDAVARLKINRRLFVVPFDELEMVKTLGRGGQAGLSPFVFPEDFAAVVALARWKGTDVAFKLFQLHDFLDEMKFAEFEREVEILSSVHHPHIVQFMGASLKSPRVGILLEYCPHGDLVSYYQSEDGKSATLRERMRVMKEVSSAMSYLHALPLLHRDLKCSNVLLDSSLRAKVMDFGVSRLDTDATKTKHVGTGYYMAPEISLSSEYGSPVDVFSFGIMLFEMFTFRFEMPYGAVSGFNVELRVANDPEFRPEFLPGEEKKFPRDIVALMRQCWDHNPDVRPDFVRISRRFACDELWKPYMANHHKQSYMKLTFNTPYWELLQEIVAILAQVHSVMFFGHLFGAIVFVLLPVLLPLVPCAPQDDGVPSCFRHRISFTFAFNGPSGTRVDPLVLLDTESLISSGKLESDCSSVRFRRNSTGQWLAFYQETPCSVGSTRFWLSFDWGEHAEEIIEVYYMCVDENFDRKNVTLPGSIRVHEGNSFYVMSTRDCDAYPGSGLELADSDMDAKFVYLSDFGSGQMYESSSWIGHTHAKSEDAFRTGNYIPTLSGRRGALESATSFPVLSPSVRHHHLWIQPLISDASLGSQLPPFYDLLMCRSALDGMNVFGNGSIVVVANSSALPFLPNVARYAPIDDLYPRLRIGTASGIVGNTGGADEHTHETSLPPNASPTYWQMGALSQSVWSGIAVGTSDACGPEHTHSFGCLESTPMTNHPDHLDLVHSKILTDEISYDDLSRELLFFANFVPPMGYEIYSVVDGFLHDAAVANEVLTSSTRDVHSVSCDATSFMGAQLRTDPYTNDATTEVHSSGHDFTVEIGGGMYPTDELDRVSLRLLRFRNNPRLDGLVIGSEDLLLCDWSCGSTPCSSPSVCGGTGTCQSQDSCVYCQDECNGRGECIGTDQCDCNNPNEWMGNLCQTPICPGGCPGGSDCVMPGFCMVDLTGNLSDCEASLVASEGAHTQCTSDLAGCNADLGVCNSDLDDCENENGGTGNAQDTGDAQNAWTAVAVVSPVLSVVTAVLFVAVVGLLIAVCALARKKHAVVATSEMVVELEEKDSSDSVGEKVQKDVVNSSGESGEETETG